MDNEIYLIHLDDYLNHIDNKLEMYEHLLELVRSVRSDLESGEPAQALRTLCAYEQQAHEMYEGWDIPDSYTESGDPDDLAQLTEDELLPYDGVYEDDSEASPAVRLLRVIDRLTDNTRDALDIAAEMVMGEETNGCPQGDTEKPENDCAD